MNSFPPTGHIKSRGEKMDFVKKFLILIAIFCVIGSAAGVSAGDYGNDVGYAGCNYEDANGVSGSQYCADDQDLGNDAGTEYDTNLGSDVNPDDMATDGTDMGHAAGDPDEEAGDNETYTNQTIENATGSYPLSKTIPENVTLNETGNSTGNTTDNAPHTMLSTGNPILALLTVGAVLGSAAVIKRK